MASGKRTRDGSLLQYFNGKKPKVERMSEDWGCLVDRTLKNLLSADQRDLPWRIKVCLSHASIRRGKPFTVHFKSNLVDETDWSR